MSISKKDFKNAQKGAALVEFAIIVPLLLLLVVGICEIGYGYYHLNILNKSVQDAARYFSDPLQARPEGVLTASIDLTSTNSSNITSAKNLVIYGTTAVPLPCTTSTSPPCPLMPTAANYTVTFYCAEEPTIYTTATIPTYATNTCTFATTKHIRVTATYQHKFILGTAAGNFIPALGTTGSYTLTASSVLRVE